ncbi:MAG: hypothetical protein RR348_02205, partial [Clostridia bacterium]
ESIKYLKQTFYRYFLHESIDLYDFRDNVIEKTRELGADISFNSLHYKKFSKLTETLNMTKPIFRYSELNHSQVETLKDFSYSLIKNDVKLFQLYNETFARLSVVQEDMNNYAGKLGIKPLQSKANYFREDSLKRLGKICLKYCNEVIVMRIKKEAEIAKIRRKEIYKNAHSSKLKTVSMIRKSYKKFMQSTYKKLHKEVSNKNYLCIIVKQVDTNFRINNKLYI